MKTSFAIPVFALTFALVAARGAEPATPNQQQLAALVQEIQTQQAQIAENQSKIETKLTAIAEAIRVARIYSSRAGH
jgi:ABC-type transporter MlaC component